MSTTEIQPLTTSERIALDGKLMAAREKPLADPQAQEIRELWIENSHTLSQDAALKIGRLFIREMLGLDPDTAPWAKIEDRLGGIKPKSMKNVANFWEGIDRVAPQLIGRQTNISYLISNDQVGKVAYTMITTIVYSDHGYRYPLLPALVYGAPN